MANATPAIQAATCPCCGVEFGIDNPELERTMAGALTGRRAMARRRAELSPST